MAIRGKNCRNGLACPLAPNSARGDMRPASEWLISFLNVKLEDQENLIGQLAWSSRAFPCCPLPSWILRLKTSEDSKKGADLLNPPLVNLPYGLPGTPLSSLSACGTR